MYTTHNYLGYLQVCIHSVIVEASYKYPPHKAHVMYVFIEHSVTLTGSLLRLGHTGSCAS
jgi:hypothetical protein